MAIPGKPTNLKVAAADITKTSAIARWTAPTDWGGHTDIWHHVQVATSPGFGANNIQAEYTVQNGTMKTLSYLNPGQYYYVRVQAKNASGSGYYTDGVEFVTDTESVEYNPPGKPTFSNVTSRSMTVSWSKPSTAPDDPIVAYHLLWSYNSDFSGGTVRQYPNPPVSISGLLQGVTYYFKVRAETNGGFVTIWSEVGSQKTLASGAKVKIGGNFQPVPVLYKASNGAWLPLDILRRSNGTWIHL